MNAPMLPAGWGIERPVIVVGAPRSGSTLLFETLARAPGLFSLGGESHNLIEGVPGLHPRWRGWQSNRLTASDAAPDTAEMLRRRFYLHLRDREGIAPKGRVRMLEKTPKNSLRIPFLARVFPDALFVHLHRDARETVSSMIEAWQSGGFRTYPGLPGWPDGSWSLLLVPGWEELRGLPVAEIAARQWAVTTDFLLRDLETLPPERVHRVTFADLIAKPQDIVSALCAACGIGWDRQLGRALPLSATVMSAPHPGKWRRHAAEIERIWPIVEAVNARAAAARPSS